MVPEKEIQDLVGYKFPGGEYTIEHWENFLLTECTGGEVLPDAMVHPVALFHVPILGSNTSIAQMFALGQAESDFSIGIESYDWEMFSPLYEDIRYRITASVTEADRRAYDDGNIYDRIAFQFRVAKPDGDLAARCTITWHYRRGLKKWVASS